MDVAQHELLNHFINDQVVLHQQKIMVKEPCTIRTETGMKEGGRMVIITDRAYCTKTMETSIQAYGMIIMMGKKKLTTRTERSIQDNRKLKLSET